MALTDLFSLAPPPGGIAATDQIIIVRPASGGAATAFYGASPAQLAANLLTVSAFNALFLAWMAGLPSSASAAGVGNSYNDGGVPAVVQP